MNHRDNNVEKRNKIAVIALMVGSLITIIANVLVILT